MKYRPLYACVFLLVVVAGGFPGHGFADLISVATIPGGIALGPTNTLLMIHDPGNGIESGCIGQNGAFTPCLNTATTHVPGGDNIGFNQVLTLSTGLNFAAVVSPKDAGQNSSSLTDLYLTFSGTNGSYTAEYIGQNVLLSSGPAFFTLSNADLAAVQSLGSSVTVSGGLSVVGQSGGPETLYVVQLEGPQGAAGANAAGAAAVPEPGTILLLGSGLVLVAFRKQLLN